MTRALRDDPILPLLEGRLPSHRLSERLAMELGRETSNPIESWPAVHWLIRAALRLALVHERARRNVVEIRLSEHRVVIPNLPDAFEGYTILHMSDLHLDSRCDFVEALSNRIQGLDYDLCVLTGDYRFRTFGHQEPALSAMRILRDAISSPVYAVLGNHDSIRMVPMIEAMEIRMLVNETVRLERGDAAIHLSGVDDPHYFRADDLAQASAGVPKDATSILLAHSPEVYRQAAREKFDLLLCGHTHGGQIRLPGGFPLFFNARCPRRYCAGAWRHENLRGYTSSGAGSSVVDVRLNCPAEVVLHRFSRVAA